MTITIRAREASQACEEIQRCKVQGFFTVTKTPQQVWDERSGIIQKAIDEAVAEAVKPIQDECAVLRGHKVGNEADINRLRTINDNQRNNIEVYQKRETELTNEIANLKQVKSELSSLLDGATQPSTTWVRVSPDTMIDSGTYHRALYQYIQKQQENNGKEKFQLAQTLDLLHKTDQRLNDVGDHMVKMRKELEEANRKNIELETRLKMYRDIREASVADSVFTIMKPKPNLTQEEIMKADTVIYLMKSREGAPGYCTIPQGVKLTFHKDVEKLKFTEKVIVGHVGPVWGSLPWTKKDLEDWLNNPTEHAKQIRQVIFTLACDRKRLRYLRNTVKSSDEKNHELNTTIDALREQLALAKSPANLDPYIVQPPAGNHSRDFLLGEVSIMRVNNTLPETFVNEVISHYCSMWIRK
jgi:hypothetical protein